GAALDKLEDVVGKLKGMKLFEAARKVEETGLETLVYMDFPRERLNREIRRRTRTVGAFPDGQSALMLVCARLRHMQGSLWGQKTYLNMQHLEELLPSDS
ncbi:MAG: transposase, partial [Anaerolineaceae bacterium]